MHLDVYVLGFLGLDWFCMSSRIFLASETANPLPLQSWFKNLKNMVSERTKKTVLTQLKFRGGEVGRPIAAIVAASVSILFAKRPVSCWKKLGGFILFVVTCAWRTHCSNIFNCCWSLSMTQCFLSIYSILKS